MEDYNAINSFPRPNLPDGFRTILFSLSKEVLREQPTNLYEFCADFFGRRLLNRGDSWITFKERYNMRKKERAAQEEIKLKAMPDTVTENTTDHPAFSGEFTKEQEEAAIKIQAGVRGMMARRGISQSGGSSQAEREHWLSPREQLQRNLLTVSESISFAKLESDDGVWEACQRWLHPADQLQRDYETIAEPVECAHLRDRGPSLEDATAAGEASAALERDRKGVSAQRQSSSSPEVVSPQYSDIDVSGQMSSPPEVGRADSPPEFVSPAHSAASVASVTGAISPTAPNRGPSIASVQSVQPSDVPLEDQTPPPPAADVLNQPTDSSQLDLAARLTAAQLADGAEGRAGSPPEAVTPRHSDVELGDNRQSPEATTQRAGSPPEAITPQHSDVEVAGRL